MIKGQCKVKWHANAIGLGLSILVTFMLQGPVTTAQTKIKADVYEGGQPSFPFNLTVKGSTLIFNARDSLKGFELRSIDTSGVTLLVNNVNIGSKDGYPFDIYDYNGQLFFSASNGINGHELWKYDGISADMAADINPDSNSSWPDNFIAYGGALYFSASDSAHGNELWKFDGTIASRITDIFPDTNGSYPNELIVYNGDLYFSATDSAHGNELWKYNGTNISLVSDINSGVEGSYPNSFFEYNGSLVFSASNGSNGFEFWSYNGSTVNLIADINPGSRNSYPHYFTNYQGNLIFTASDSIHGHEIWRYDGTTVELVQDINPGPASSFPADFTEYMNEIYFNANDGLHGFELWKLDALDSTEIIADIDPGSSSSCPVNLTVFSGELYFRANDGIAGPELWSYIPCELPDTAELIASDTLICSGSEVTITVANADSLHGGQFWVLYADSLGGIAEDSSETGIFTVKPDTSTMYFVRGEGCDFPGEPESILIETFDAYYDSLRVTICEGDSFAYNNQVYYTAGIHDHSFQAADSCDSTVTLVLTLNPAYIDTVNASICDGDSIGFDTLNLKTAGFYSITHPTVNGCDSTLVMNLTVNPTYTGYDTAFICQGEVYQFGAQQVDSSGNYTEIFQSAQGCDSTVLLNFTVHPVFADTLFDTICGNESYVLGSQVLSTTGSFTEVFQSVDLCDSSVTLNLTVMPVYNDTLWQTICEGDTFIFGNMSLSASGLYVQPYQTANQCDSNVTLILTVLPVYADSINRSICEGDTFKLGSQLLTAAGTYTELFQSAGGCDSVVTLTLNVNPVYQDSITDSICNGQLYFLGSQLLTSTGTYTEVFNSVSGCDSTVTLSLTVLYAYNDTISDTICEGETYVFGSMTLTATGTYTQSYPLLNLCDSTITLNLAVMPVYRDTLSLMICEGESFVFGSQLLDSSGVYDESFQSVVGCDSLVNLTLTVKPVYIDTVSASICSNESFNFGSLVLTTEGIYTHVFQSVDQCDSTVTLQLSVSPAYSFSITDTICSGESYVFGSQVLTTSGTYTQLLQTAGLCDSTITLDLTVLPSYLHSITASICEGETYNLGAQMLNVSGNYTEIFQSVNGCDSTVNLNLTVNPLYNDTVYASICSNSNYIFGSQVLTTAGNYTEVFQSANQCDSTVTLQLSVSPAYSFSIADTICSGESYVFGSQVLTTSGTYTQLLQSAGLCDSTITLDLTVLPSYLHSITASICEGETYNLGAQLLNVSGNYTEIFQSVDGCDSTVNLNLTVNPVYNDTVTASICSNSSYVLGNQVLTTAGIYTELFQSTLQCDSLVTLILDVRPAYQITISDTICAGTAYQFGNLSPTLSGSYTQVFQSVESCDSVVTLNLTVLPTYQHSLRVIICDGETYSFGGMVLNTTGIYYHTFQTIQGCDSTIRLSLNVIPTYSFNISASICNGQPYVLGNQVLTASGTYTEVFSSVNGCDSIVNLNLTVYPVYAQSISASICSGEVYTLGTQQLTNSGSYSEVFQTINGCDSLVTLNLIVYPLYNHSDVVTICSGEIYNFGSQALTTAGNYTEVFQSIEGCDSTVHLTLNVNPVYSHTASATICNGTLYNFGSQVLTTTGIYTETFNAVNGCDSVVTLTLTVNNTYNHFLYKWICNGQQYILGTQTLTTSGIYTEVFQSINGCDSMVTANLTVDPSYHIYDTVSICSGTSYSLGTQVLSVAGTYAEPFYTVKGCDSLVTLTLIVNPVYNDTITTAICDGETYNFGPNTIDEAGTYVEIYQTINGCDSIEVLELTVYPVYEKYQDRDICGGSVYSFGSRVLDSSGVYFATFQTIHGCDSSVQLDLTVDWIDATVSRYGNELVANYDGGYYQWFRVENSVKIPIAGATKQSLIAGKNGKYAVKVSNGVCSNISADIAIDLVGVEEIEANGVYTLFPNPNNGQFVVVSNNNSSTRAVEIEIYNATGQKVITNEVSGNGRFYIDAGILSDGVYILRLKDDKQVFLRKFIVE